MSLRLSTGLRNKLLGLSTTIGLNPTFDDDTTGWTAQDATLASVASGQSENALEITETGSANPGIAYQDFTTVIGRIYELSVYFKKGTSATGSIEIGTTGDPDSIHASGALSDADWTLYQIQFRATATTTRVSLITDDATAGETSLFDECVLNEVLDGFKEIMRGCKINVYTGSQPATADTAASGTLLYTLSLDGGATGLSWGNAVAGVIAKVAGETWQGTAVAGGVAGWFRTYEAGTDPAIASEVAARFDGAVGTSGAEMNMSFTTIANGAVQTLSNMTYTQPAS